MPFTVLVLQGAYPSAVALTIDVLEAAQALGAPASVAELRFHVCSPSGGPVALSPRFTLRTARLGSAHAATTWIVPGLGATSPRAVRARLARPDAVEASRKIARHVARGGSVAASCSAVFLLQQAGVLRGRRATTTWWLGGLLAEMEKECAVDTSAMVCADGPIVTAGAALAQTDLMLHLLRARRGQALTDLVARTLLLDARQVQARFVVPELLANGDPLVTRVTELVEATLPEPPSVAALCASLGMTERTLSRHVRRATGQTTMALLHGVRARRAQVLLKNPRMSIEAVAAAVGYQDASTLRRLLRKIGAAPPRAYRNST